MRPGGLFAALLLLAGCTLGSEDWLIARSDAPAQVAGRYQLYVGGEDAYGKPDPGMACLEPGAVRQSPVAGFIHYCSFEDEGGAPPRFVEIAAKGSALVVRASHLPPSAGDLELRFLRLADGVYLAQLEDGGRFDLWIARMSAIGIELYALDCDDVPGGTRPSESAGFWPPCSPISLEALRPGLKTYVGWIAEGRMPFAVLKRL